VFGAAVMASLAIGAAVITPAPALAADNAEVEALATASLSKLYAENPAAVELSKTATGVLVFPNIKKAGLGVGGEVGKGILKVNGATDGYYRTVSLSFGAQAGFQSYGYVIMFLTADALAKFKAAKGFELGVDGSVAVLESGASVDVDTTNIQADTVGFVFDESGLMAGATIEGSKITRLKD
jgi:lipid-binding SYLF domain-containing protein